MGRIKQLPTMGRREKDQESYNRFARTELNILPHKVKQQHIMITN